MADALQEMAVFSKVVAAGSLSAAARELGLSPALVSRRLAALESRLGVRLVNRTTRSLNLTVEGSRYYDACTRVLAEIEEADAEVSAGRVEPQGALKVAPNRRVVCASPAYLAAHGTPHTPEDLAKHNCLVTSEFAASWEYKAPDGRSASVRVQGRYACDNWEVLREWALAGLGIALKSTWDVYRQLQEGSLVALLPGYAFHSDVAIYAVYPHRRFLPAKTRVFIEFLAQSFSPEPYWDRPAPRAKPRIRPRAAA